MLVNVTQEHINKGSRRSCGRCPVALALDDAGIVAPAVGPSWMYSNAWDSYRFKFMCPTPPVVVDFMGAFDTGLPVQPFSFEIPDV